jgi:hypothetical protein
VLALLVLLNNAEKLCTSCPFSVILKVLAFVCVHTYNPQDIKRSAPSLGCHACTPEREKVEEQKAWLATYTPFTEQLISRNFLPCLTSLTSALHGHLTARGAGKLSIYFFNHYSNKSKEKRKRVSYLSPQMLLSLKLIPPTLFFLVSGIESNSLHMPGKELYH